MFYPNTKRKAHKSKIPNVNTQRYCEIHQLGNLLNAIFHQKHRSMNNNSNSSRSLTAFHAQASESL